MGRIHKPIDSEMNARLLLLDDTIFRKTIRLGCRVPRDDMPDPLYIDGSNCHGAFYVGLYYRSCHVHPLSISGRRPYTMLRTLGPTLSRMFESNISTVGAANVSAITVWRMLESKTLVQTFA
jgi:hypothetical protein